MFSFLTWRNFVSSLHSLSPDIFDLFGSDLEFNRVFNVIDTNPGFKVDRGLIKGFSQLMLCAA